MGEEKKNVLTGSDSISMSAREARALLGAKDGTAALLYIYLLSSGGMYSPGDAASALGCTSEESERALGVLSRLGLAYAPSASNVPLTLLQPDLSDAPTYSATEIGRELEAQGAFRMLVDEVEKLMGTRLMNPDSYAMQSLFRIYDYLNLPMEVILHLVAHCVKENERTSPGRKLNMKHVEKIAFEWARNGITTLEQAEAYIRAMDERRTGLNALLRVLGIRDRQPSPSEKAYLEKWLDMGFREDAVFAAYDRTVMGTGHLAWRYMDSILASWHTQGLHSLAEIEEKDAPAKKSTRSASAAVPAEAAPDSGEMDKLRRFIDSMNS